MKGSDDIEMKFVRAPLPAIGMREIAETLNSVWGITGDMIDVDGDRDQNIVASTPDGTRRLVKIGHADEVPEVVDMQIAALLHVAAQDPELPVPRPVPTREGYWTHAFVGPEGTRNIFRVFSYIPGSPIGRVVRSSALMRAVGAMLARLDSALRGFFHPGAGHNLCWDLRQAPSIRSCAYAIGDTKGRDRVLRIFDEFIESALPRMDGLRAQVIHGDATPENVLAQGDPPCVSGLIDFGDTIHAPVIQELAVAMATATWDFENPWAAACQLAAGFDERFRLEADEVALLWHLARMRMAFRVSILAEREVHRSEGLIGSMGAEKDLGWWQLDALESLGHDKALSQLRQVLRIPESVAVSPPSADVAAMTRADMLVRRRRDLMPGLSLFYPETPLHAVRGDGMWLIDSERRHYLDCYNNVPQVGHAHPHVVNAVVRQTETLNTNTRYLYDSVLEYAERLADLLPGSLSVVMFMNSGSEANDVAWRIATACTGNCGALVTENAYHGNTEATAALSPHGAPDSPPLNHVRRIAPPDEYRGVYRRGESAQDACYTAGADRAILELESEGYGIAAFIADSIFASDGILEGPGGYLTSVFERVRSAGGVCIADEVQAGFGRCGTWWGFETHGVIPDIVTLGKPVANGYPAAAVVTTPELMATFAERTEYFSTFGGNPVGCAAGLAVIDVIEREGLCGRAAEVGGYLKMRLAELMDRHALIGDVRGRGLFLGVDLVRDRTNLEPAVRQAAEVADAMRRRGVLVGISGRHENVLKIRPPIVCERSHADMMVDALDSALASV